MSTIAKLTMYTALAGLALTLVSIFTVFIGYPGWTIGIAIGSVIDVAIVALLYLGGDRTARAQKTGITILFYFLRFFLLAAGLLIPAFLDYKLGIPFMKYSAFGAAIGYIPGVIVIVLVMTKIDAEIKGEKK